MAIIKTVEVIEHFEYTCDFCKKEVGEGDLSLQVKFPVRFMNEQTEGRPVTPYVTYATKDLCEKCFDNIVVVQGSGAQGSNSYKLR